MERKVMAMLIIAVSLTATVAAAYAFITTLQIPGSGHLATIQAYAFDNLTSPIVILDWGTVSPDSNVSKLIWLRNTGDKELTLNMTLSSITPSYCMNYMKIEWNREGVKIGPKSTLSANITLTVYPNATLWPETVGDFSHVVNINGA